MIALGELYSKRFDQVLVPVAQRLQTQLVSHLEGQGRVDSVRVRPKSVDRFLKKAQVLDGKVAKYVDPLAQIQDQLGARIVTYYLTDVEKISNEIGRYYRAVEAKTLLPESDREFGYFGKHYIFLIPTDVVFDNERENCPVFFELQVKTLFQHAWSEAEHDLGYKPSSELSSDQRRRFAFTAAQAWGADMIFEELRGEIDIIPGS